MAHLDQERRHSSERVIGLAGHRKACLIADVHAAAGLGSDEALLPESPDRVADRHPGDAEELREQLAAGLVARSADHFAGWADIVEFTACTAARMPPIGEPPNPPMSLDARCSARWFERVVGATS